MESTHRWYPLVREWERTLRAENKSKNTIAIYGSSRVRNWKRLTD